MGLLPTEEPWGAHEYLDYTLPPEAEETYWEEGPTQEASLPVASSPRGEVNAPLAPASWRANLRWKGVRSLVGWAVQDPQERSQDSWVLWEGETQWA